MLLFFANNSNYTNNIDDQGLRPPLIQLLQTNLNVSL